MERRPDAEDRALQCSVVVPVFNEAAALRTFIPELRSAMSWLPAGSWELIFVDDHSTDASAAVVREYLQLGSMILVQHNRRRGSGAARKTGSRRARGEWVMWIDGDGTYDSRDLAFLWMNRDDVDQVVGCRTSEEGRWPVLRAAVKSFAARLASTVVGYPVPDLNSGLRALRRSALMSWLHELPEGFSCTSTATLASMRRKQRVRFVDVCYRARSKDTCSKFHPVIDTVRLFSVILKYGSAAWAARRVR